MTRSRNIAQVNTVPGRSAAGYGTPVIEHSANTIPGRSAMVSGPPPKNAGECGALTREGKNCKAPPTKATGLCVGHSKQQVAREPAGA